MGMHDSSQNFYHTFATLQATISPISKGYMGHRLKSYGLLTEKRFSFEFHGVGGVGTPKLVSTSLHLRVTISRS